MWRIRSRRARLSGRPAFRRGASSRSSRRASSNLGRRRRGHVLVERARRGLRNRAVGQAPHDELAPHARIVARRQPDAVARPDLPMRLGPRPVDVDLPALAGLLRLAARREDAGDVEPHVETDGREGLGLALAQATRSGEAPRRRLEPGLELRRSRRGLGRGPRQEIPLRGGDTLRGADVEVLGRLDPLRDQPERELAGEVGEKLQDRPPARVGRDAARHLAVDLDELGLQGVAELERAVARGHVVERDRPRRDRAAPRGRSRGRRRPAGSRPRRCRARGGRTGRRAAPPPRRARTRASSERSIRRGLTFRKTSALARAAARPPRARSVQANRSKAGSRCSDVGGRKDLGGEPHDPVRPRAAQEALVAEDVARSSGRRSAGTRRRTPPS